MINELADLLVLRRTATVEAHERHYQRTAINNSVKVTLLKVLDHNSLSVNRTSWPSRSYRVLEM